MCVCMVYCVSCCVQHSMKDSERMHGEIVHYTPVPLWWSKHKCTRHIQAVIANQEKKRATTTTTQFSVLIFSACKGWFFSKSLRSHSEVASIQRDISSSHIWCIIREQKTDDTGHPWCLTNLQGMWNEPQTGSHFSLSPPAALETSGDHTHAGLTELTRILSIERSSAIHLVIIRMAPLVAEYVHLEWEGEIRKFTLQHFIQVAKPWFVLCTKACRYYYA